MGKVNELYLDNVLVDDGLADYDYNWNVIHFVNEKEHYEEWFKYDERSNQIYYANTDGYKEESFYDSNDNLILYKDSDGSVEFNKYDENNNCIYHYYKYGSIEDKSWMKYDNMNNCLEVLYGDYRKKEFSYNKKGECTSKSIYDGYFQKITLDFENKKIIYDTPTGKRERALPENNNIRIEKGVF